MANLVQLLQVMVKKGATELIVTTGSPPQLRIDGHLMPIQSPALSSDDLEKLVSINMIADVVVEFKKNNFTQFTFSFPNIGSFIANIFSQRHTMTAIYKSISASNYVFQEPGIPPVFRLDEDLAKAPVPYQNTNMTTGIPRYVLESTINKDSGLVIISGPSRSGKSTTLASIVNKINLQRHQHIITIEDPIIYTHAHVKSIISQIEIRKDAKDFGSALENIYRIKPAVIVLDEMSDKASWEKAIDLSDSGCLVIATLTANSCLHTINRIVNMFPIQDQQLLRNKLASCLNGIICQKLLLYRSIFCMEFMLATQEIKDIIGQGTINHIYQIIRDDKDKNGMFTFSQSIASLYLKKEISLGDLVDQNPEIEEINKIIERAPSIVRLAYRRELPMVLNRKTCFPDEQSTISPLKWDSRKNIRKQYMKRVKQALSGPSWLIKIKNRLSNTYVRIINKILFFRKKSGKPRLKINLIKSSHGVKSKDVSF